MKTLERNSLEATLAERLDGIASTVDPRHPGEFDPNAVRLVVTGEERPPRRTGLVLAAAAVAVVAVGGLVVVTGRDVEPTPADQPGSADPEAEPLGDGDPAFRFETPTVHLDAGGIEVITPAGSFSPSADVVVAGDPGMPDEYTSLELTWFVGEAEQRINIYFASDGATWWAHEIRTYDGTTDGEWFEPVATGRFFETAVGDAFTGDLDLSNLHITDMTLQAFVPPSVCDDPDSPVAVVADYPSISAHTVGGRAVGGFGASFQVYDTAACQPLPIADYSFDYSIADPSIATITAMDRPDPTESAEPAHTIPGDVAATEQTVTTGRGFDDIKNRVDINFLAAGTTTLHATVTDSDGAVIGTADAAITVTDRPVDQESAGAAGPTPTDTAPPGQAGVSLPAGSQFQGVTPSCTTDDDVVYECTIPEFPRGGGDELDMVGYTGILVDDSSLVSGGCRSVSSDATQLVCYVGRRAVDEGVVGADLLGEWAPRGYIAG